MKKRGIENRVHKFMYSIHKFRGEIRFWAWVLVLLAAIAWVTPQAFGVTAHYGGPAAGGGTPGGTNGQIQVNQNGQFAGESQITPGQMPSITNATFLDPIVGTALSNTTPAAPPSGDYELWYDSYTGHYYGMSNTGGVVNGPVLIK